MKKLISTIALFALPIALFAQEAAQTAQAQVPKAPKGVGEYFGMSDAALFSFITTIIILLVVGVTIMFFTFKTLLKSDEFRDKFFRFKGDKTASVIMLFLFGSYGASAADSPGVKYESVIELSWTDFYVMLALVAFLIFQYAYYSILLFRLFRAMRPVKVAAKLEPSVTQVLSRKLTGLRDIEEEKDLLLDHDYDGIQELDNSLPPWWKWGFYLSIVWAVGYIAYYHVFDMGESQVVEFQREMIEAEEQVAEYQLKMGGMVDEFSATLLTDVDRLKSGEKIFTENCQVCHGERGKGDSGPNLTDTYWIHGGDIKDVFRVIKHGAPNGMKSWKGDLTAPQIHEVASYVKSLVYISVDEGGKAPQGNVHVEAPQEVTEE